MTHFARRVISSGVAAVMLAGVALSAQTAATQKPFEPRVGQPGKDVVWVPTPQATVDAMLNLAKLTKDDFLIDLGSGDGITVITAAKRGARAMGIEFNPDMVALAEERIVDLKSRGYENAGLYDPQGVGGTHVMYVLHHADRPSLYAGLPDDPQISPTVQAWKGPAKNVGLAMAGVAIAGAALHGLFARANKVAAQDEADAQALVDRAEGQPSRDGEGGEP